MLRFGENRGEGEAGTWRYGVTQDGHTPSPGADRDMGAGQRRQRGECFITGTAVDASTRNEVQGRAAEAGRGGYRQHPGGWLFAQGEELGGL